ncbi:MULTISPECIES: M15 family metallopeptidase [Clostridium]|uniref:M15 family metallopeptidase n=1 Tax=Clostridium senegalense TaxID=1465809 RepID=A0A6M0H7N2_9CLOT|nr:MULTISPECIES: M15 family metallopeptidase [Clostridium]NEU06567.1 M15 family metallopeptidase [Clostridium senegalense]
MNRNNKKIIISLLMILIAVFTVELKNNGLSHFIKEKEDSSANDVYKNISIASINNRKHKILIVNRDYSLDKNFIPKELVKPNIKFLKGSNENVKLLDKTAALALEKMFSYAEDDGIYLLGVSGYRDYYYQKLLYDNEVKSVGKKEADRAVAKPGESGHQTGLAIDILSEEYTTLDEGFQYTKSYKWITENSYKYGFIIRYPRDKENITGYEYEPWHIRYVGEDVAKEMFDKNITLEEYVEEKESCYEAN